MINPSHQLKAAPAEIERLYLAIESLTPEQRNELIIKFVRAITIYAKQFDRMAVAAEQYTSRVAESLLKLSHLHGRA